MRMGRMRDEETRRPQALHTTGYWRGMYEAGAISSTCALCEQAEQEHAQGQSAQAQWQFYICSVLALFKQCALVGMQCKAGCKQACKVKLWGRDCGGAESPPSTALGSFCEAWLTPLCWLQPSVRLAGESC